MSSVQVVLHVLLCMLEMQYMQTGPQVPDRHFVPCADDWRRVLFSARDLAPQSSLLRWQLNPAILARNIVMQLWSGRLSC
jgi:hypothetical protein